MQAIEAGERLHEKRGDQQSGIRVMIWIANIEAGALRVGRGEEVQIEAQAREDGGHDLFYEVEEIATFRRSKNSRGTLTFPSTPVPKRTSGFSVP